VRLKGSHGELLRTIAPLFALLALVIYFSLENPRFFSTLNLLTILRQSAVPLILATGMMYVVLMGSIDLSVEGNMALSGIVTALLLLNDRNQHDWGLIAILPGILVGALIGFVNGLILVKARIPSFMVTLGTWFFALGVAIILYKGYTFPIRDQQFVSLYIGRTLDLSNATIIAFALVAVGAVLLRYTRFGRYLYAIGGNEELAKMSGIRVDRYKILAFVMAGLFFGIGGVLNTARLGQGTAQIGSWLFPTIAAVVVGGVSIAGGTGTPFNAIVGVFIIVVVQNGMTLLGMHPFNQMIVQGLIFIVAVYLTLDRSKIGVLK
jgi:ribose transport system permease protein